MDKKLFDELKKSILSKASKNSPVIYMPNGGNWGDGLIRAGTLKFFKDIGLSYTEIPSSETYTPPQDALFIYGGGGGWCKYWNHAKSVIENAKNCRQIIVLPSTYAISILKQPNIEYWARDTYSSLRYNSGAKLCPDMALYLDKVEYKAEKIAGYFYRTDIESNKVVKIPATNIDISLQGDELSSGDDFIKKIAFFERIYTDRLHVAIAGYLTNREVYLSAGSYSKIYDFYKTWFSDQAKIHFVKDPFLASIKSYIKSFPKRALNRIKRVLS